jgi:hypothetical protein
MVLADDTPEWALLAHPAAAGYALVTDSADVVWDQTPIWTGSHTWDDGSGDSPSLILVGGSNDDTALIFLDDDAVAGDSDLVIRLVADDADAELQIQNQSGVAQVWADAAGNLEINGALTIPDFIYHQGDADTFILLADDSIAFVTGLLSILTLTEAATDTVIFGAQADLNGNLLVLDGNGNTYIDPSVDDVVSLFIGGTNQYEFDGAELTLSTALSVEILWIRAHGDVTNTGADILCQADGGFAAQDSIYMFIDSNSSDSGAIFAVAKDAETISGATVLMRVTEAPILFLNETAESDITIGFCVNQAGNDDYIATFKSSDVSHPMTDFAEADTYGAFNKSAGAAGGLQIRGFRDSGGSAWKAAVMEGFLGEAADTTKSTAGHGVAAVVAYITNGGTGITSVAAAGNLFSVENNGASQFIVGGDGSLWATGIADFSDGGVRTIWSEDNVGNPPTDADLDTAFGTPATVGEGFHALVDDNNLNTTAWAVWSLGGSWWYAAALTKAT